jgi:Putative adhesin
MTTFQTPAPIAVDVEVLSATVNVIASDRTDTVVQVQPADPAKKGDVRAAAQTRVDFTGGVLTVTTPKDWRTYTAFGGNPTIAVTIEVPTGSRLSGTAGCGNLYGNGELGEIRVETSMGDIVLDRPLGSVTAKTAKGNIRIGAATRGEVRLETSMGDLEVGIRPGSAVTVHSNTMQGAVQNQLGPVADGNGDNVDVYARTSMGNIVVRHAVAA